MATAQNYDPTYDLIGIMTMVTTDCLGHFLACTHDPPNHINHSICKQKPMNRNQQTKLKMDNKNVPNNTSKSMTKPTKKLKK